MRQRNVGGSRRLAAGLLAVGLAAAGSLVAHPELLLQIEQLTRQIEAEPDNPELYLKRGNLHRRHRDWEAGLADFNRVRELRVDDTVVDWYEGHLNLDAGEYARADVLLSRYLDAGDVNPAAFQHRAMARLALGRPLEAAGDLERAVAGGQAPGPELYQQWSLALLLAGGEHREAAMAVARAGVSRTPGEPGLSGLAVDIALASGHAQAAKEFMQSLGPRVAALPQWHFRAGLLACLEGRSQEAERLLESLLSSRAGEAEPRAGTWRLAPQSGAALEAGVTAHACVAAARAQLDHMAAELPPRGSG